MTGGLCDLGVDTRRTAEIGCHMVCPGELAGERTGRRQGNSSNGLSRSSSPHASRYRLGGSGGGARRFGRRAIGCSRFIGCGDRGRSEAGKNPGLDGRSPPASIGFRASGGRTYFSEIIDGLPFWRLPIFGMMLGADLGGQDNCVVPEFVVREIIPCIDEISGNFRCSQPQSAAFAWAIYPSTASESSG